MRCTCAGRPFERLSDKQKQRRKVEIKDALGTICSGITDIGLSLTFIQLETTESHETVSIVVQPPQCSLTALTMMTAIQITSYLT